MSPEVPGWPGIRYYPGEITAAARAQLPGATVWRRLFFRYTPRQAQAGAPAARAEFRQPDTGLPAAHRRAGIESLYSRSPGGGGLAQ